MTNQQIVTMLRSHTRLPIVTYPFHTSDPGPFALLDTDDNPIQLELARIMGSIFVSELFSGENRVRNAVRVAQMAQGPVCIAINVSPFREFGAGLPPTDVGRTWILDQAKFLERMTQLREWIDDENRRLASPPGISVGAVCLDAERFNPQHTGDQAAVGKSVV